MNKEQMIFLLGNIKEKFYGLIKLHEKEYEIEKNKILTNSPLYSKEHQLVKKRAKLQEQITQLKEEIETSCKLKYSDCIYDDIFSSFTLPKLYPVIDKDLTKTLHMYFNFNKAYCNEEINYITETETIKKIMRLIKLTEDITLAYISKDDVNFINVLNEIKSI